ncbi:cytochrome b [Bradyrhizobium sp. USDA 4341]
MSSLEQEIDSLVVEQEPAETERQVWDLPVRIFHWCLVLAFLAAFVTNRLGVAYFKYHVWSGYAVLTLVSFRIVWGFVGARHALFKNFLRGPREILAHARSMFSPSAPHYAGHNPLGALMVVALLLGAAAQAVLGLFSNDEIFNVGPLYGLVTKDLSLMLTSLHRRLFYLLAAAIAIHVLAVIAHKIFKDENLIRAMITGRKPLRLVAAEEAISSSRLWIAAPLALIVIGVLAWIILNAPATLADASEF